MEDRKFSRWIPYCSAEFGYGASNTLPAAKPSERLALNYLLHGRESKPQELVEEGPDITWAWEDTGIIGWAETVEGRKQTLLYMESGLCQSKGLGEVGEAVEIENLKGQ